MARWLIDQNWRSLVVSDLFSSSSYFTVMQLSETEACQQKQQTHVNYCMKRMEEINYYVLFLNSEKGESSILSAPQNQIPS